MKIEQNKAVSIHYTLKNDAGEVLDSSQGKDPLNYIHGVGFVIKGLEEALEGKCKGDKINTTVPPEKAYGQRDESRMRPVPKSQFGTQEIKVGMQFKAQSPQGEQMVMITKVEKDTVTVDANHPLAGTTLQFDVEVMEVREPTKEEKDHGHIHKPDGQKN